MKPEPSRDVARLITRYVGHRRTAEQLKRLFAVPVDSEGAFGDLLARLEGQSSGGDYEVWGRGAVEVRGPVGDGSRLILLANLSDIALEAHAPAGRTRWSEGETGAGRLVSRPI